MAVDYLKTYLGIDPNDYSSMEARIRGEEPQAQAPIMMRQPMMMPQQKSLGDIEAMQLIPRQQPAPQPAPQVDDRYQGLMDQIAALRSQIDALQAPVVEEAPVMAPTPAVVEAPTPAPAVMGEPFQAPPEIENRMVGEPEPMPYIDPYKQGDNYVTDDAIYNPTGGRNVFEEAKAPAEDIQASIDYLAKLPKMNIPQIPDIEEIKRKMAEANMNFPEPVSYEDQLQSIRDLPPMTQMPTREEIQAAMQNMPTPTAPASSMPKFNLPQMQSFGLPQQIAGGRTLMSDFSPRNVMRMANGGGIDQAIYDLKFKLNG
jgi:hypothetical protein